MTADTMACWPDSLVSPLVKSRNRDTEKHRDLLRSPRPIFDRIKFQPSAPTAIAAIHNHLYIVSRRVDPDGDPTQVWAY
jgi:hypothetical protein